MIKSPEEIETEIRGGKESEIVVRIRVRVIEQAAEELNKLKQTIFNERVPTKAEADDAVLALRSAADYLEGLFSLETVRA